MKARISVASTAHAETRDLHELYTMSEKSEGPTEKNSMTIAAFINAGPMSPTVVGVDEVVGVDDGDAGDRLVLGRRRRGWTGGVGGGYEGSGGGGQRRAAAAARLGVWRRCSKYAKNPDSVTKTGADGGVPAPRETARRIPREVNAR